MWSVYVFFFFKQKTAYEMRISDWSSDVCSSDLVYASDEQENGDEYVDTIALSIAVSSAATKFRSGLISRMLHVMCRKQHQKAWKAFSASTRYSYGGLLLTKWI